MIVKEQYGNCIIDIMFKYKDTNGNLQSTGWITKNPDADREIRVVHPELKVGSYARLFQAIEGGGYGIIDTRLGMMIPID